MGRESGVSERRRGKGVTTVRPGMSLSGKGGEVMSVTRIGGGLKSPQRQEVGLTFSIGQRNGVKSETGQRDEAASSWGQGGGDQELLRVWDRLDTKGLLSSQCHWGGCLTGLLV